MINTRDILETINMIDNENLDVRTITMGISLLDCADEDADKACQKFMIRLLKWLKTLFRRGSQSAAV